MKPSAVMPSSIGASGGPPPRIWKKWSITQIESKPASSAARVTRARVGPISLGPPGPGEVVDLQPEFHAAKSRQSLEGEPPQPPEMMSESSTGWIMRMAASRPHSESLPKTIVRSGPSRGMTM